MTERHRLCNLLAILLFSFWGQGGFAATDDFIVRGATSTNVFKLADARGKFVVLHFLLKTECPVCLRHTHEYAQKAAGDTNLIQIFLKPDTEEEIKRWATKLGDDAATPVIYRDPDAALAKRFNLPDGYQFHGQKVHFPALLILDGTGKEVFRYVGKSNADRYPYEKFAQKLKELTAPSRK
jgi:peroxiredoxin Q/BCP